MGVFEICPRARFLHTWYAKVQSGLQFEHYHWRPRIFWAYTAASCVWEASTDWIDSLDRQNGSLYAEEPVDVGEA